MQWGLMSGDRNLHEIFSEKSHEMDDSGEECEVVVIGGGLAGLMAARTIVRHDCSLRVSLLEADHRLGGRVLSVQSGGRHLDLGAHWVSSSQPHILGLVRQFNLGLRPQYLAGRKLMQVGDLKVRSYDSVLPSLGSWLALLELGWLINKLDSLASEVNTKDPVASLTEGDQLDAVTVSCWLSLHTRFQAVRDVVAAAIRTTFGVEPGQMSVLFFLRAERMGVSPCWSLTSQSTLSSLLRMSTTSTARLAVLSTASPGPAWSSWMAGTESKISTISGSPNLTARERGVSPW